MKGIHFLNLDDHNSESNRMRSNNMGNTSLGADITSVGEDLESELLFTLQEAIWFAGCSLEKSISQPG